MAIEIVDTRPELAGWLEPLNHLPTAAAVHAERAVSRAFGGSCQIPLAAYATVNGQDMHLRAFVATTDGRRVANASVHGSIGSAAGLVSDVVAQLTAQDAAAILAQCLAQAES